MKTLLVLDLDGTALLRSTNAVSAVDRRAAQRLLELGVELAVATGRLWDGTKVATEQLQITGPICVMNGSSVVDSHSGESLHSNEFSSKHQSFVEEHFVKRSLPGIFFESHGIRYEGLDAAQYEPYLALWSTKTTQVPSVWSTHTPGLLALSTVGRAEVINDLAGHIEENEPELCCKTFNTFEGERWLEVRRAGPDKGTALKTIAKLRGYDLSEVIAVGDWWNDLPMLKLAGRSFVMRGATAELLAHAEPLNSVIGEGGAIAEIAKNLFGVHL